MTRTMLHLLGRPFADLDGEPAALASATSIVVALLVLQYGNVAERAVLAAQLWEDSDAKAANNAMRQVLSRLKQFEHRSKVSLLNVLPQHLVRDDKSAPTDLEAFLAITEIGTADELQRLLDLYRGDFLDGVDASGDLREWIDRQRATLRERFLSLATAGMHSVGGPVAALAARRIGAEIGEAEAPAPTRPAIAAAPGVNVESAAGVPVLAVQLPSLIENSPVDRLANSIVTEVTVAFQRLQTTQVVAPHSMRTLARDSTGKLRNTIHADYEVHTRLIDESPSGGPAVDMALIETASGLLLSTYLAPLHGAELPLVAARAAAAIARQFADAVALRELNAPTAVMRNTPYLLYLSAQRSLRTLDLRRVRQAKTQLRQAIDQAPHFAPLWSMLAHSVSQEWTLLGRLETEALVEAERLAKIALELDPGDARAHRELGRTSRFLRDLDESLLHYANASALMPNDADLAADYADTRVHASDLPGARRLLDHAMRLNPIAPDEYLWTDGALRFFDGDYDGALAALQRMRDPEPATRLAAAAAAMTGAHQLANSLRDLELSTRPGFSISAWMQLVPVRERDQAETYVEALRLAGFPA